ncbi:MAG: hypothetical protein J6B79_03430 [Clostridia bacterium]|nr:hypothetical protein [Clostridia bacterium]
MRKILTKICIFLLSMIFACACLVGCSNDNQPKDMISLNAWQANGENFIEFSHQNSNAQFECVVSDGSFSYENETAKTITVPAGKKISWKADGIQNLENKIYADIVLSVSGDIYGYGVVEIAYSESKSAWTAKVLASKQFKKTITLSQVKSFIANRKVKLYEEMDLESAFNHGCLTAEDLKSIAYYHNGETASDFDPVPIMPLISKMENNVKLSYLKSYSSATLENITAYDYYGTYNGYVVAYITCTLTPTSPTQSEKTIGGVKFYNYSSITVYNLNDYYNF